MCIKKIQMGEWMTTKMRIDHYADNSKTSALAGKMWALLLRSY